MKYIDILKGEPYQFVRLCASSSTSAVLEIQLRNSRSQNHVNTIIICVKETSLPNSIKGSQDGVTITHNVEEISLTELGLN
jgi:DNA-binding IscR family transcriptional regulator